MREHVKGYNESSSRSCYLVGIVLLFMTLVSILTFLIYHTFFLNFEQVSTSLKNPNFVFILTDDQDQTLHGMDPMTFTKKFFQDGGVEFKNAFVSTPVCCPSRASLLTGRYQHNTGVLNNTLSGNCCGADWRSRLEPRSLAVRLRDGGYNTFYAGKYLNQYGMPSAGGVSHVPPGWDWWIGLVGNSRYYNYTLSVNGTARKHGDNYEQDYLTDVIKRYALEFLRGRSAADSGSPFFLMVAPPAPHAPQTPAPQYAHRFPGARAPRTASYNRPVQDRHRLLLEPPAPLPDSVLDTMDAVFRDRWRSLLSVDDMVEALVERLAEMGVLENTYLIYTSDHGYHLGQFSLTLDKRQPYEFDLRVPLYVRGPRLPAGRAVLAPVSTVDLASTVLQLAGMEPDPGADGVPLTQAIGAKAGTDPAVPPRTALLVSYNGETGIGVQPACRFRGSNVSHCYEKYVCKCQDSADNTYRCIREMSAKSNQIVCRFQHPEFWEAYDLSADPDQLVNMAPALSDADKERWRRRLDAAEQCSGASCRHI